MALEKAPQIAKSKGKGHSEDQAGIVEAKHVA